MALAEAPTRAALVAQARDIYDDIDLGTVRQWLADHPGQKAGGYLPVYAPREIMHACGMLPVGIHGGGDHLEIIRGDAFYQSYICHLPRSVIELAQSGRLDMLSAVLFPSTCDVIRNLSGMWKLLYPDAYVRYIDVPQIADSGAAADFWESELRRLVHDLGEVSGHHPTDADLRASVALYNETRAMIRELYKARRERPWDVPTEELYVILRAGEVLPAEAFIAMARDYLAAVAAEPRRPRDNSRVVVVGAFCEQPPLGLIMSIEKAGCYVVEDDFLLGNRFLTRDVPLDGDPVRALAEAFVSQRHAFVGALRERPGGQEATDEGSRCSGERRRDHLRHAELLRPRAARPADASHGRREGEHPVHRVQVRREHRAIPAVPRTGRDVRRLDQALGGRLMAEVLKDRSMVLQKEMIASHFTRLASAKENGEPVVYTFVPGNLTELIRSFGALPVLPEINALQSGMRKLSGDYIAEAERGGHSEDVCTYVKCDIGMLRSGNIGPAGTQAAEARPAAPLVHRLLHVHEVVRAAARGVRLPDGHVPRSLPGRRHARAGAPRVHAAAAARNR